MNIFIPRKWEDLKWAPQSLSVQCQPPGKTYKAEDGGAEEGPGHMWAGGAQLGYLLQEGGNLHFTTLFTTWFTTRGGTMHFTPLFTTWFTKRRWQPALYYLFYHLIYYKKVANCPLPPYLPLDLLHKGGNLHLNTFFTTWFTTRRWRPALYHLFYHLIYYKKVATCTLPSYLPPREVPSGFRLRSLITKWINWFINGESIKTLEQWVQG